MLLRRVAQAVLFLAIAVPILSSEVASGDAASGDDAVDPAVPVVPNVGDAAPTPEAEVPTTGSLVFAIVQSAIMGIVIGPPLLFFGTAVPKSVIVIQALLQFGYTELMNDIMGADIFSIGQVLKACYVNIFGALMLIIASLHREEINILNKSLLTGRLLVMPFIESMAVMLFDKWGKCTLYGQPSEEFPFGEPGGEGGQFCRDKYDLSYLGALYIYHGAQWLVILTTGYLGTKYGPIVMIVSCALAGATLTLDANLVLAQTILKKLGDPEDLTMVNTYFTQYGAIANYVLVLLGCFSMLTIRGFVSEMKKQEHIKKDILKMLAFKTSLKAVEATAPDVPELKKDLKEMQEKSGGYVESMIAKDELDFAQIWPLGMHHRKKLAKKIRKKLEPDYEEKGGRMSSQMWDHKLHGLDPDGTAFSQKAFNKQIWKMKVKMPIEEDAEKLGITYDADGCMTMRAYHELLASYYDHSVEDPFFEGQALLFKNRFFPILWPACCKFPAGLIKAREKIGDFNNPNKKYNLGKKCWPPLRGIVVGPAIKNKMMNNRFSMMWFKPLISLNIAVMNLQYSPFSPWQIIDNKLNKFALYRGMKNLRKKGLMASKGFNLLRGAKVGPAGEMIAADEGARGKLMSKISAVKAFNKAGAGGLGGGSKLLAAAKASKAADEPAKDEPAKAADEPAEAAKPVEVQELAEPEIVDAP